jgi:predicted nucleic acid-binding protein
MGLTVIDADVFIALLNPADANHTKARKVMLNVLTGPRTRVMSAFTLAEILVGPLRADDGSEQKVDLALRGFEIDVLDGSRERARQAAAIRGRTGARLPDAFVLAAAIEMKGRQPDPVTITSFDKRLLGAWKRLSLVA